MSSTDTCQACTRLWHEFVEASSIYVELLKQEKGTASVDPAPFRANDAQAKAIAARRDAARSAFHRHVASTHPPQAMTASG
jgi:hypothetical protein